MTIFLMVIIRFRHKLRKSAVPDLVGTEAVDTESAKQDDGY
jgi:hypothetical protein